MRSANTWVGEAVRLGLGLGLPPVEDTEWRVAVRPVPQPTPPPEDCEAEAGEVVRDGEVLRTAAARAASWLLLWRRCGRREGGGSIRHGAGWLLRG